VHGLAAIVDSLEQLVHPKKRDADVTLLRRRLAQIAGRGACRHPDGAAALVSSALRVFAGEVDRHMRAMDCSATRRHMPSSS
jgi:NADH:ubiquinone oxidoreductase subunit F (NADH-binding)